MRSKRQRLRLALGVLAACLGLQAGGASARNDEPPAEDPLSAIDWLSQSLHAPPAAGTGRGTPADEPPVDASGAMPVEVVTTPLDRPLLDSVGLLAPATSGLPADLWGPGPSDEIARAIATARISGLPVLRDLLIRLLLSEARAPADAGTDGGLLQVRIDKLLQLGALDQAAALVALARPLSPELFRRAFDIALLTGDEERACHEMLASPGLAPTLPARVFCLARGGNWDAAALTLQTARALGEVGPAQAALLERFLDPEADDEAQLLPPPVPVTPLDWKIHDGIGETLPTSMLPLAFAHADLDPAAGWKARIEAAERLTRAGVLAPNVLLGFYTEREAAASGGVWDRVAAFRAFDAALAARDPDAVARTLPSAWARMQEAELEVPFATLYGEALAAIPLSGEAARIAFRIGLLSPQYQDFARDHGPPDEVSGSEAAFLVALALGRPPQADPARGSLEQSIAAAFVTPAPSSAGGALREQGRIGEAILMAMDEIDEGAEGDLLRVTQGLSLLRELGFEDVARRAALELVLLERRG